MRSNKITAAGIWQDMQDDMLKRRTGTAPALIWLTDEQIAEVRADPEVDSYLSERDGQMYFLLSRVVPLGPAATAPPAPPARLHKPRSPSTVIVGTDNPRHLLSRVEAYANRHGRYPSRIKMTHKELATLRADQDSRACLTCDEGGCWRFQGVEIVPAKEGPPRISWTQAMLDDLITRRDAGEKLRSIGDSYGVTAERIRQLDAKERRRRVIAVHRAQAAPPL